MMTEGSLGKSKFVDNCAVIFWYMINKTFMRTLCLTSFTAGDSDSDERLRPINANNPYLPNSQP